jgi:hypothetical protein
MWFAADPSCQNVLQLSKKNQSLEKNSSVLCESLEIAAVTRPDLCIASRPFG